MTAQPFDIDLIIERLKIDVPDFRAVEGACEYAAITGLRDFAAPCAYVLPIKETPDDKSPKGGQQRAIVSFGVVIAVRNYRDTRGGETTNQASPFIGQVRQSLMGFAPQVPGSRDIKWLGGNVLDYDKSTLLWSETFQTQMFVG